MSHLTAPSILPTSEAPELHLSDQDEYGPDKRGHKGRERKCVVTSEVKETSAMIRFVRSPNGAATPDIVGKLPGRGVWVTAKREILSKAVKTKAFARGFKTKTAATDELIGLTEALLKRRLMGLLAMARKSGHIAIGYDQVKAAAGSGKIAWRIEARDGAEDGRGKIRTLAKAVAMELEHSAPKCIGCFTNAELAHALGRDSVVHIALPPGKLAKSFGMDAVRYSGFVDLIPQDWNDVKHEMNSTETNASHARRGA